MKARALLTDGSFDPATVAAMTQAFDEVWAEVGPNFDPALSAELARMDLADVILANAPSVGPNIQALKNVGRKSLATKYPWLIDPKPK
jgi:hypothetical protein